MHSLEAVLQKYWGYNSFRPKQKEIITSVLDGNDVFALLPTGAGKSLCFQVPALVLEGMTIVISPLIALMRDQVDALKKRGIPAGALFSGMSKREASVMVENAVNGGVKILYISPERLQSPLFLESFKYMKVSLIAVDEAHCISQWGYDFRPHYLTIAKVREIHPSAKIIALTATATPHVVEDIIDKLALQKPKRFNTTFLRPNLSFRVLQTEDSFGYLTRIFNKIQGSGIVYVATRRQAVEIAQFLTQQRISAKSYHAGMTSQDRMQTQISWINSEVKVIVATNAFGMGIDKGDVRCVVHWNMPDSLEAYYQEAGRAGRDGQKSYAIAFFNEREEERLKEDNQLKFPKIELIRLVYKALASYFNLAVGSFPEHSFDFNIKEFCQHYRLEPLPTFNALKTLEREGYIQFNESFFKPSSMKFVVDSREVYQHQVVNSQSDVIIKLLLRMYGGAMYTSHVKIDEYAIAKTLNTPTAKVIESLNKLVKFGICEYFPKKEMPQITFVVPRQQADHLQFDLKRMQVLEEKSAERLKQVLYYVHSKNTCRSVFFASYFGDDSVKSCGICDICETKSKQVSLEQRVMDAVIEPIAINDLMHFLQVDREVLLKVLRYLVDNQKIVVENNMVYLK